MRTIFGATTLLVGVVLIGHGVNVETAVGVLLVAFSLLTSINSNGTQK